MTSAFTTCAGCGLPFADCACPPVHDLEASGEDKGLSEYLSLWSDEIDRSQMFGFLKEPAYSTEEPWQLVANRQTGRTTRMVRAATEAARSGLHVSVLTLSQQHEESLRRHFGLPVEVRTLATTSHEFSRQYERDLKMWLRREPGRLRLVDPAVIEKECHVLLREYHRYDAGYDDWAREQSRRVGAERERHNNHSTVNIKGLY